jgi:hypothetical protein
MSIPEFVTCETDEGVEFKVYFDYDPGEDQWFDARAGVGSPGYPASIEIMEVDFGCGREDVGVYPQLNLDAIHNQIVDSVQAAEEDDEAEYLEHLIAKHEDSRRLEDYQ